MDNLYRNPWPSTEGNKKESQAKRSVFMSGGERVVDKSVQEQSEMDYRPVLVVGANLQMNLVEYSAAGRDCV